MPRAYAPAVAAAALFASFSTPAAAQLVEQTTGHWVFGLGAYDVHENSSGDMAADFRAEYRAGYHLLKVIRPFAGVEITSDATLWAGVGIAAELPIGDSWFAAASFAPGVYAQGGSDLDLGHTLEFRTQAEVGYQFDGGRRLSLAYSHLSNAGLGDENPGAETIALYYHQPF